MSNVTDVTDVNVGFLGARGQFEEDHAPAYKEQEDQGVRMVAVADLDFPRAQEMAEAFGIPDAYPSLDDMLAGEPRLDALVIAVPTRFHAPLAVQALNAGVNVFVEKPMAIDYPSALEMAETARTNDRVLWPSAQYRYMAELPVALVRERELGRVQLVRAEWLRRRGIPDRATFISSELAGGGAGMDLLPHLLAVVLPALGMPQPLHASARAWSTLGRRMHGLRFQVEERLAGVVDLDDGTRLEVDVAWAAHMRTEERLAITFDGAEATLDVPLLTGQPHTAGFDPSRQHGEAVMHGDLAGMPISRTLRSPGHPRSVWECIQAQTRGFLTAVRAQRAGEAGSPALDRAAEFLELGVLTQRIIALLYRSAMTGGRVATPVE
jgi:predicted dehydrogenase